MAPSHDAAHQLGFSCAWSSECLHVASLCGSGSLTHGIWVLRAWYKQAFTCGVQQDVQRRALSGLGL